MRLRAAIEYDATQGKPPTLFRAGCAPPSEGVAVALDENGAPADLLVNGELVGRAVTWPRVEHDELWMVGQERPTYLFRSASIDCVLEF